MIRVRQKDERTYRLTGLRGASQLLCRPTDTTSMLTRAALTIALLAPVVGCDTTEICPDPGPPPARRETGSDTPPLTTNTNPFKTGPFKVDWIDVEPCTDGALVHLAAYVPERPGTYPLIIFQHGISTSAWSYDTVLHHLASHGFVVVAPILGDWALSLLINTPAQADADLLTDLIARLPDTVPGRDNVFIDHSRMGLAGHSRGAKIVWLVANDFPDNLRAVGIIEPVDSTTLPLGNADSAFDETEFDVPTVVVGAGFQGDCYFGQFTRFFEMAPSPAWQIELHDVAHLDIIDDADVLASELCVSDSQSPDLKKFMAGMLVTLFRETLQDNPNGFMYLDRVAEQPYNLTLTTK